MQYSFLTARYLLALAASLLSLATLAAPARAQQQEIPKTTAESIGGILSYTRRNSELHRGSISLRRRSYACRKIFLYS